METGIFGWFALLGFVLPPACSFTLMTASKGERKKRKINSLLFLVGCFCALTMILLGIHLWINGFDSGFGDVDPSLAARTSTRAGGKGGIIILILQFLPQFFVFGYGWHIWEVREIIPEAIKTLKK